MEYLKDLTKLLEENSPEFLEELENFYVKPLTKQGCIFMGYGAMGTEPSGVHILIFELPDNLENLDIEEYEDEGTSAHHWIYMDTLHIIIPIPY